MAILASPYSAASSAIVSMTSSGYVPGMRATSALESTISRSSSRL